MNRSSLPLLLALLSLTTDCANPDADPRPPPEPAPPAQAAQPAAKPPAAPPAAKPRAAGDDVASPAVRVPIDGLPAIGSDRALVTVVAFTDYECPYCARAEETLAALRAEYGERVRLVIASRPLPMHERAAPAARAFLAAAEQGKAAAMHARLFARGAALDEDGIRAAARASDLDLATFERAWRGPSSEAALQRVEELASKLAVEGTPTFFVNGRRLVGARPPEVFRALIDEELGRARMLVETGVRPEAVYQAILAAAPEAGSVKAAGPSRAPEEIVDVGLDGAPTRGPARAPITVVLFSDFECPYCVKAEGTLRALEAANPGKVRVAFRHRPLPMHPHARLAAKASLAAERQGRFWDYHDALLQHRSALEREELVRYAAELGLDRARFSRDLDDPEIEAKVAADEQQAERLGVKGTPTAFINGRRLVGAQPLETWMGVVDRAMRPPS